MRHYMETGESGFIGKKRVLPARRKDGSEFPVELTVVEVRRPGGSYFCGYIRLKTESNGE
jgi:hypothetical protein